MEYLQKVGFLAHCLLLPVLWGLGVEWVFHAVRTHRNRHAGPAEGALPIDEPDAWSCKL